MERLQVGVGDEGNTPLTPCPLTVNGRVKEVVSGLLKRGRVQDAVLHLGDAEPGDPQHLTLHHKGGGGGLVCMLGGEGDR